MSRYLDPKADVVFKKIFGDHPKLLISFLNALLPLSDNSPIVSSNWYHYYQLIKQSNQTEQDSIEHLQLIFIELPKFPIQSPEEKKLRLLWLRFLREINEKTIHVSQDLLDIPEIAKALELAEESAYTKSELNLYDSYWDQVSREKTLMSDQFTEGKK